jgi:hypothetical protein
MSATLAGTMSPPAIIEASVEERTQALLQAAEAQCTKPLWAQMSRLNPPLPNPKCTPHVWRYDEIRPNLLQAGELVTEKQAERRVLMLVNPSRGQYDPATSNLAITSDPKCDRCTIHDRHHLWRPPTGHAQRDGSCPPTHSIRLSVHH